MYGEIDNQELYILSVHVLDTRYLVSNIVSDISSALYTVGILVPGFLRQDREAGCPSRY